MSAPDANALPPAPVTTTTRTDLSDLKSCIASMAAVHISSEMALCRSILFRMIQPTPFSFLEINFSLGIHAFLFPFPENLLHFAARAHRGRIRVECDVRPLDRLARRHRAQQLPAVREAERQAVLGERVGGRHQAANHRVAA